MRGADAGAPVLHWLVRDGELAQVVAHHLRLDFYLVEGLAVVHANHGPNHLGHDNHVPQVGADGLGLLPSRGILLGLPELLNERKRLPLQTTLEPVVGVRAQMRVGGWVGGWVGGCTCYACVGVFSGRTWGSVSSESCNLRSVDVVDIRHYCLSNGGPLVHWSPAQTYAHTHTKHTYRDTIIHFTVIRLDYHIHIHTHDQHPTRASALLTAVTPTPSTTEPRSSMYIPLLNTLYCLELYTHPPHIHPPTHTHILPPTQHIHSNTPSAGTGVEELDEFIAAHVQELIKVHPPIGELAERPLLGCSRGMGRGVICKPAFLMLQGGNYPLVFFSLALHLPATKKCTSAD